MDTPEKHRWPRDSSYTAGATNRLTRVDEGNTITDFDDDEIQRKITISTALAFAEWAKKKINLIDTPGFNIFINDTKSVHASRPTPRWWWWTAWPASKCRPKRSGALRTNSSCRAPSSSTSWTASAPASSARSEASRTIFGRTAVPIHLPIGSEKDFKGVVDLVRMKAYTYTHDGDGKGKEGEIPADLADAAQKAHEALIEMVAEGNDALLEEFFDKGHAAGRAHPDRLARRPSASAASSRCCALRRCTTSGPI